MDVLHGSFSSLHTPHFYSCLLIICHSELKKSRLMLYSFRPTLITEEFFLIFSVKANLSNIVTDPNYATDMMLVNCSSEIFILLSML